MLFFQKETKPSKKQGKEKKKQKHLDLLISAGRERKQKNKSSATPISSTHIYICLVRIGRVDRNVR